MQYPASQVAENKTMVRFVFLEGAISDEESVFRRVNPSGIR
jgi:hypothetical protein